MRMKERLIIGGQWLFLLLMLAVFGPAVIFTQIKAAYRDILITVLLGAAGATWFFVDSPLAKYGFLY
ncbi:MAG: hypothetical protein U7M05_12255, partial [Candidatus Igneacidithiobacillus chanchocoensis]